MRFMLVTKDIIRSYFILLLIRISCSKFIFKLKGVRTRIIPNLDYE